MCKLVKVSPKPAHKRAFLLIDQPNCGGSPAKRARGKPLLEQSEVGLFSDAPRAVVKVFYKGRLLSIKRRRTSPAGTVSQPIGKPFNGQAKGLLWQNWRSYAGPPQYYITPEGGAINPPVRRSRSQAEPWQPWAERPGGWLNPHARIGVSPQLPDFKSPRWDVSFRV